MKSRTSPNTARLTLGPLVYHWAAEKRRDFYFSIADEAPVDEVYLGEMVCSKRASFFEPYFDAVIDRLSRAGKKIIFSSPALMASARDIETIKASVERGALIEANDLAAVPLLAGKPFVIGPMIPALNEGTISYLAACGATRIVFASEMTGEAMSALAAMFPTLEAEAQVFGRQPLAIAARCYHARSVGRDKNHCRFACAQDEDGLAVQTLDGKPLWTVTGTHTLSAGTLVLCREALKLQGEGVSLFRLAPQTIDMVCISSLYRGLLDGKLDPEALIPALKALDGNIMPINGFYYGREGMAFAQPVPSRAAV